MMSSTAMTAEATKKISGSSPIPTMATMTRVNMTSVAPGTVPPFPSALVSITSGGDRTVTARQRTRATGAVAA